MHSFLFLSLDTKTWAKLTYSYIGAVCPITRLKINHVSTLTFSTNGVKKNLSSLFHLSSLSPQLLFYQATMAELVQAMRDGQRETQTQI